MEDHSIAISLGRTCIGIRCEDEDFLAQARRSYQPFLATREPDFWIKFRFQTSMSVAEINRTLLEVRGFDGGDRFSTEPKLLDFYVDWNQRTLYVETERAIFARDVEYKLMNQLLSSVYYTIWRRCWCLPPDAFVVHGCGIAGGGSAYLFTGPSGIGKTTVAKLADGRKILNDEMVLVGNNDRGFYVAGTPFDGGVAARCDEGYDLTALLFLKQAQGVSLKRLGGAEAYLRLLGQTLEVPLFGKRSIVVSDDRADFTARLAAAVPCYELAFRLDNTFWGAIEGLRGGLCSDSSRKLSG